MSKPAAPAVGGKVKAQFGSDVVNNVPNAATGRVSITTTTANVPVGVQIVYPQGRFVNGPAVTATAETTSPQTNQVGVASPDQNGFYLYLNRSTPGTTPVQWIAIENP